jgi:fimbrial isopeptide formation D2 family protein/LPXTG-motif cell wall-anchored protein
MKKILSLILALSLVLSMGISVHAAESYTITINNSSSGHTYEAYQVFTGNLSESGVLSNVGWGSGVNSTALLAALKADATVGTHFTGCTTAADVAKAMNGLIDDSTDAKAIAQLVGSHLSSTVAGTSTFGTNSYAITPLNAGYYLVKDKDDSVTGAGDSYTRFILEVVGNVSVTPKGEIPTVTKKVKDVNDSTGANTTWQDSADYDIGDAVPFELTGTLPTNYNDYSTYAYIFHDTMSAGLTLNSNTIKVSVDGVELDASKYTVVTTGLTDGCTFEVRFANLKSIAGITADSDIVVDYTATLNSNAVLGSAGNPNKVSLQYSNNPNSGGEGKTGETPKDTVIVFTYKVVINKVDQNGVALAGAEFTLQKYIEATASWTNITVVKNTAGTIFTFSGLDDGIYRLTETVTPSGYNTIDPIYFNVTATHDITSDIPALTSLSANQTDASGTNLTNGISATFVAKASDGSVATNIVNNTGATLPSTGGIGTTIFYILGGIIMAAAAILFVAKKRRAEAKTNQ